MTPFFQRFSSGVSSMKESTFKYLIWSQFYQPLFQKARPFYNYGFYFLMVKFSIFLGLQQRLLNLTPVVNFINILRVDFATIILSQKITKPNNCNKRKATKKAPVKC